jgi:queuine tRNA-ribosyltransferase
MFELVREEDGARRGRLHTTHGVIDTPAFMPVGTQATVRALSPDELQDLGVQVLLGNTYHLGLRPGADRVARLGGLHRFMGWPGAILTDSGGFQVFSLDHLVRVTDAGADFRSHLDGSQQHFTPESVMTIQRQLGSDIAMALDEPVPWPSDEARARAAMERTHRWAERCLAELPAAGQLRFGIAQGGFEPELRRESGRALRDLPFDGYAIGGLSLGEPKPLTYELLGLQVAELPRDRPRYLMGVGTPADLIAVDGSTCGIGGSPTTPGRSTRGAAATAAGGSPGLTCATSSWRGKSWPTGWRPSITCSCCSG